MRVRFNPTRYIPDNIDQGAMYARYYRRAANRHRRACRRISKLKFWFLSLRARRLVKLHLRWEAVARNWSIKWLKGTVALARRDNFFKEQK